MPTVFSDKVRVAAHLANTYPPANAPNRRRAFIRSNRAISIRWTGGSANVAAVPEGDPATYTAPAARSGRSVDEPVGQPPQHPVEHAQTLDTHTCTTQNVRPGRNAARARAGVTDDPR